jgi:DNA-binding XRE family transcriptional regulator
LRLCTILTFDNVIAYIPQTLTPYSMASKLPNYIRTHRRRSGLTQSEMATLLGWTGSVNVSLHERFQRLPSLKTALAYEAILGVPVAELFAGLYQKVGKETSKRARILARKLEKSDPGNIRKRDLLRAIEITPAINKENP